MIINGEKIKGYCISTDFYNYYYLINIKDIVYIVQADRYQEYGIKSLSKEWKLVGFKEILPFGNLGATKSIEDLLDIYNKDPFTGLKFKNKKGRYILLDYDHGTIRLWNDRINSIWEITL